MRASAVRVVSRDLEIPALRKTRTRQSSAAMLRLFHFSSFSLARYAMLRNANDRYRSVARGLLRTVNYGAVLGWNLQISR